MGEPGFKTPNNDCPTCTEPSKTYHRGAKTVINTDGSHTAITSWCCEHKHEWDTEETR